MGRILLKNDVTLYRDDGSCVKFHITSHVGSGASCVVYHAITDDNTEHLLKEYYPRYLNLERDVNGALIIPEYKKEHFSSGLTRFRSANEWQKEVRLSEKLKNFTANVQGYFYGNNTEYIDMTVFAGRTYDGVRNENLQTLLRRMKVLTQVIENYHKHGLLHLDIKPENVYVRPKDETVEDVMLFDFDSVIEECHKLDYATLSYTKTWAAPEQLLSYRRSRICKATDLFSIGEIIFSRIFGRHSTIAERRSFSDYKFDTDTEILKNVNPMVYPLLKELFSHTICNVVERRYQTAEELITLLDKIIPLADSQEQFLVSTLPAAKDFFIGRDQEIEDIHTKFLHSQVLFLHGIGGIGKSELAKQYAKKYMNEYDTILFVPYIEDIISMITNESCIQISNFSRIMDEESGQKYYVRKIAKIKELVARNADRILLIVDNLDSIEDKNIKILFELGCRVLITSRLDLAAVFKYSQIEIKAFSKRKFMRMLFKQYYQFVDDESEEIDVIINLVHGHTLAIELIAKQIDAEWSTVKKIRERLEAGGVSSIGDEDIGNTKDDMFIQDSAFGHIKALFDLSVFEKFGKMNELHILTNLSLMPFAGVNRSLFADWCDIENYGGKSCLNNLIKSGWIQRSKELIMLHPLVSEVAIKQCKDIECNLLLQNVAKNIRVHISDIWQECMEHDKNAMLYNGIANKLRLSALKNNMVIEIFNNLGLIYLGTWEKGYWKMDFSYECLNHALKIGKYLYGDNHLYVGSLLNNLGAFYKCNGEYEKAQYYFENALKVCLEKLGKFHIITARVLFNMGALNKDKKDYESALKYYQQVLQIYVDLFGEKHLAVAQQYSWISYLYRNMGIYSLSKENGEHALSIYKKIDGADKYAMNIEAMIFEIDQLNDGVASTMVFLPDDCYVDYIDFSDGDRIEFSNNHFEHFIPAFMHREVDLNDATDYCELILDEDNNFCQMN